MVGFESLVAVAAALMAATFAAAQDPNYEVRFADGSGEWAAAYKKAKTLV